MTHDINRPEIAAEVRAAFEAYNAAIDANDVAALNGFFWQSPETVRFGMGENLFGHDAIAAYRSGVWKPGSPRKIGDFSITTLGDDFAVTNAVFSREGQNADIRQSQAWARFPQGWRIVAAHVSALKRT
jgi:hypothetical protein